MCTIVCPQAVKLWSFEDNGQLNCLQNPSTALSWLTEIWQCLLFSKTKHKMPMNLKRKNRFKRKGKLCQPLVLYFNQILIHVEVRSSLLIIFLKILPPLRSC